MEETKRQYADYLESTHAFFRDGCYQFHHSPADTFNSKGFLNLMNISRASIYTLPSNGRNVGEG